MSEYLILLVLVIIVPFLFSFESRVRFYKSWSALFKAIVLTLIPFIIWDILFTAHGIWHFNDAYVGSFSIAGLPLEEWLFFIAVPYSCLYIYRWVKYTRAEAIQSPRYIGHFFWYTGCICVVTALFFFDLSYTLVVFGTLGFLLLLTGYQKPVFLSDFLIAFLISLIPFFIVNGYLTAKPVVLYDDSENLGIRLMTIPLEDVFYCFLLLLTNTYLYERFLKHPPLSE